MAGERMIVMAGTDERDLTKLAEYEGLGGYGALEKARAMSPNAVCLLATSEQSWSGTPRPVYPKRATRSSSST